MKAYMVYVIEYDLRHVYDCHYSLFKTYDAAKAAMEKEYKENYGDYNMGRFDERLIIATNLKYYVNIQISETELED